jgi:O-antigen ligase
MFSTPSQINENNRLKGQPDRFRMQSYAVGLAIVKDNYMIGIGYGNSKAVMAEQVGKGYIPHNVILGILGELGLVGLFLLLWLTFAAVRRLTTGFRITQPGTDKKIYVYALALAFVAVAVSAQFRPQLENPLVYVILAMVFSISNSKNCPDAE